MFIATTVPVVRRAAEQVAVRVDSATVSVLSDSAHPHIVRVLEVAKSPFEALITNPGFIWIWSLLAGLVAFAAGRLYERWNDNQRKRSDQWTAARLTRRYLLLAEKQLRSLVERATDPQKVLAAAHVEFVQRAIADFDEIKARMIVLEDDGVEEAIFQWNIVALDDLKELHDSLTMDPVEYASTHGVTSPVGRPAAVQAALLTDAANAQEVVAKLGPYLSLRKAKQS